MIVGVRLPCFRLAAALRRAPGADARAVLVERFARRRVLEATDAALAAGVRPGMALREAVLLAPSALIVPDDPVHAAVAWQRVFTVLRALPVPVEDGGPGLAFVALPRGVAAARWFDVVRERLSRGGLTQSASARSGLAVRCGAGPNRFTAFVATHRATDAVCRPGREANFVANAPLELLALDDDVVLRLRLLGVRTLGQLAALNPLHLRRFGPEAVRWSALARSYDEPETAAAGV